MKIIRVIYLAVFLELFILAILFYREWPVWLMVVMLSVVVFLFVQSSLCGNNIRIYNGLVERVRYIGDNVQAVIQLKNDSALSANNLCCDVGTKEAGDADFSWEAVSFDLQSDEKINIVSEFFAEHVGINYMVFKNLRIYDALSFFKKVILKDEVTEKVYVLPKPFEGGFDYMPKDAEDEDDRLFVNNFGNDEEFSDIREYIPGDKLNRIHWKLTSKYDKLFVRDRKRYGHGREYLAADFNMAVGSRKDRICAHLMGAMYERLSNNKDFDFVTLNNDELVIIPVATKEDVTKVFINILDNRTYDFELLRRKLAERLGSSCQDVVGISLNDNDDLIVERVTL